MNFLKKNYEKVILMGLLLAFIGIMIRVVIIINQTQKITEDDLQIPTMDANYEVHSANSDELRPEICLQKTGLSWQASRVRDAKNFAGHYCDLLTPFPMAVCPHCNFIAPKVYFADGQHCPECGKELKAPLRSGSIRTFVPTKDDTDGDGIKDQEEERYALDKVDPYDAQYDIDGDGFSNIYEIQQGYDPVSRTQHPPLWERVRFLGLNRVELPVKFLGIDAPAGSDDVNLYELRFSTTNKRGKERKYTKRIQDQMSHYIEIPGEPCDYQITKAGFRQVGDKKVAFVELTPLAAGGRENLTLPPPLEMVAGEKALSSDARPEFEDVGEFLPNSDTRRRFVVRIGGSFQMGNANIGRTKYYLDSISEDGTTAILRDKSMKGDKTMDSKGRKMMVTRDGMIPPAYWIIRKQNI